MMVAFRSAENQKWRDRLAQELRVAHRRNPQLGRALGRLHRGWERRRAAVEEGEVALLDRCWWRRQERAEVMRGASRENSSIREGARS